MSTTIRRRWDGEPLADMMYAMKPKRKERWQKEDGEQATSKRVGRRRRTTFEFSISITLAFHFQDAMASGKWAPPPIPKLYEQRTGCGAGSRCSFSRTQISVEPQGSASNHQTDLVDLCI